LIHQVLETRGKVLVVVITSGDGQVAGPLVVQRRLIARPADYVLLGNERQGETLKALQELGLGPEDVLFLGYPDRGLYPMWLEDWPTDCPWQSRYTRRISSPYTLSYSAQHDYCGSNLLDDLRSILAGFQPNLVALPSPEDTHPDHQAASNFARLAILLQSEADPQSAPQVLEYLVHYAWYPQPRGTRPQATLVPPLPLILEGVDWVPTPAAGRPAAQLWPAQRAVRH